MSLSAVVPTFLLQRANARVVQPGCWWPCHFGASQWGMSVQAFSDETFQGTYLFVGFFKSIDCFKRKRRKVLLKCNLLELLFVSDIFVPTIMDKMLWDSDQLFAISSTLLALYNYLACPAIFCDNLSPLSPLYNVDVTP